MKFLGGDKFNCSNLQYKLRMLICKLLASSVINDKNRRQWG